MTDKERDRLEFAKNSVELRPYNNIHYSAIIDPTARIGKSGFGWARDVDKKLIEVKHAGNVIIEADVEIGEFCTVHRAVKGSTVIGEGSKIDAHCHCAHGVIIGKYNTIADNSTIEGSCIIGDYNEIGSNVTIIRKVKVGNNCLIGSNSTVTKDVPDNAVVAGSPARILRYRE
jgi:UDP-3-O-[3-hydroxymyristoyl] glucosamine N-acyltransferase